MRIQNNDSGFTLVEVIVASLILFIVVISLTSIFMGSFKNIIHTGQRVNRYYELQDAFEQHMLEWQNEAPEAYTGDDTASIVFGSDTVTVDGQFYIVNEDGYPDTDGFVIFVPSVR